MIANSVSTLWDAVWEAGQEFNIAPGSPNLIERIEAGLLSYGNEMTRQNNPLECGMEKYCSLDKEVDCVGWNALRKIADEGPERRICGVAFDGEPVGNCRTPWPVMTRERIQGRITTMAYSPRLESNVGLGMMDRGFQQPGQPFRVQAEDGTTRHGRVVGLPMGQ